MTVDPFEQLQALLADPSAHPEQVAHAVTVALQPQIARVGPHQRRERGAVLIEMRAGVPGARLDGQITLTWVPAAIIHTIYARYADNPEATRVRDAVARIDPFLEQVVVVLRESGTVVQVLPRAWPRNVYDN